MGIDEVGIDEVGIDEVGINLMDCHCPIRFWGGATLNTSRGVGQSLS